MPGYYVQMLGNDVTKTFMNILVSATNYAQGFGIALRRNNSLVVWFSFLVYDSNIPRSVSDFWLLWLEIQILTYTNLLTNTKTTRVL